MVVEEYGTVFEITSSAIKYYSHNVLYFTNLYINIIIVCSKYSRYHRTPFEIQGERTQIL